MKLKVLEKEKIKQKKSKFFLRICNFSMVKVKFLRKNRPNLKIGLFFKSKKTVLIRNPS